MTKKLLFTLSLNMCGFVVTVIVKNGVVWSPLAPRIFCTCEVFWEKEVRDGAFHKQRT